MVERWRPETHCFQFPFGEVTITLQDVHVMFGLHIDGDDVYMQDVTRRIRPCCKYSCGSAVLAYLYRALCRASIDNVVDICGFIPLLQVWCWERILHVQPSAPSPHDGDTLLPYARRWTRGIDRDTESHHVLIPIRDQLDGMMEDQFRWTPYNEILHTLLRCCTIDETLWMACVPILCLEIVEVHTFDRVMRQFGRPQHVPAIPSWGTNHHVHDQRRRLGPEVLEMLVKYFDDWGNRHQSLEHCNRRLLIGKPALDDMSQTPGRKKIVTRIVKNVNINDLLAKKRKRDNEDEDGWIYGT
ncbi:serine/threonine-protein phosphatase 7 long form homolog [Solanum stenotomum]|uniref:serine/threonine-protein phosphatase 7 long form homolog n=1 Tax=Solanum stenotomum TaxID=172797 RepID=UPI0020D199CC|nr:serine/threonine-protein phosphatase 7 long form homolog [Solanum stenotomum]